MKTLLLLAALSFRAFAQAPAPAPPAGTLTKVSTTTLQATAGTISCTFVNSVPAAPGGVQTTCTAGTATLNQAGALPSGNTSGVHGGLNTSDGNFITWIFTMPAENGPVNYEISANGQAFTGTF